jgi:hypothetical protein
MPTNNFGQTYNNGVKYIKINRFDSGGLDRTDYLQQLQSLRINYDDLGPIEYNIITIQEQNDYYVYGIQPKAQSTSSINFEVLDYSFLATSASSFTNIPNSEDARWGDIKIKSFGTVIGNSLGYLNISNAKYALGNTPNVYLQVKFSGSYTLVGSNTDLVIGAGEENTPIFNSGEANVSLPVTTGTNTFNKTITLSGSANLIENNNIVFGIGTYLGATVNITFNSLHVSLSLFTASINPATSSLTIFNPDFLDFEYNDYNALFGNAEQPQYSSRYMDVDYSSDPFTPVNFDLIISGTADRAQVQDSNYKSSTWSDIRYNGSRYSSFNFNQPTAYQINNGKSVPITLENYIQDSNYNLGYTSGIPSVEQNQTYMAYFDGVGGTGPELIDQTAYFIKYLIDSQGNTVNPEPGNTALLNLIDNFEPGKNATVRLISSDPLGSNPNAESLVGTHKISHVGRIVPILVTETGFDNLDYVTTMSFGPSASQTISPVGKVGAYSNLTTSYIWANSTDWTDLPLNNLTYAGAGAWTGDGSPFTAVSSSTSANTRIKFMVRVYVQGQGSDQDGTNYLIIRIVKNGSEVVYAPTNAATVNPNSNYYAGGYNSWESGYIDFSAGNTFTVQYKVGTGGTGFQFKILGEGSDAGDTSATILQEIPSTPGGSYLVNPIEGVNVVYSPYLQILDQASKNYSILLFSTGSRKLYNSGLTQNLPTSSATMGFSPIELPFNSVSPGDYIRFEYKKDQVYCITEVGELYNGLAMKVVPNIGPSETFNTTITDDHFVIYRVINDGTYVVLAVPKTTPGSSFTGIIQPEYISQELKGNYSNIIQDLTSKGTIS